MAVLAIAGPVFGLGGGAASAQEERPHIGVGGFMRQIAGFASNDRLSAG